MISLSGIAHILVTILAGFILLFGASWKNCPDQGAQYNMLAQNAKTETSFAIDAIYRVQPTPSTSDASEIYVDAGSFVDLIPNPEDTSYHVMEYCFTDPLNRITGYVISSQKATNIQNVAEEIPNSQYLNQGFFKDLRIIAPLSGDYKLQVIGIRDGGYKMYFTLAGEGRPVKHKLFNGISRIISPGTTHTYQIAYDRDDVSKSQLIKIITLQEIENSLNIASKFHWIDNNEIHSSLTQQMKKAKAAHDRGEISRATAILEAFINEVERQKGKHIKNEAADIFIDDAQTYIEQLNGKKRLLTPVRPLK